MFASSTRLLRTTPPIASRRLLHSTPTAFAAPGKDPQLSQGLTGPKSDSKNRSPQDVQSDSAESGHKARASSSPQDAASGAAMSGGAGRTRGNPEGIGSQEQVGGASASARRPSGAAGEKGGAEEASAPGYVGKVKQALGLAGSQDVKRDDRRSLHTSAVARAEVKSPREPKEPGLRGEQNEHLRHKREAGQPDSGKGNAGKEPELPSQKTPQTRANAPSNAPSQTRGLHTSTSAWAPSQRTLGDPSADPEQQSSGEVRAPSGTKSGARTEGGGMTLAELEAWRKTSQQQPQSTRFPPPTRRPKHSFGTGSTSGRAELHTSAVGRAAHTAESYFKDVDKAPSEGGGVHKVDSSNAALDQPGQRSGPYHRAGVGSDEYKNVSKDAPYNEPGADQKENLRYGGTPKLGSERSGNNPQPRKEESPAEGNKGGRGA